MERWLSFDDVCLELGLGSRAVSTLLRSGALVGYRLPRQGQRGKKNGQWRILDPGHRFARYLEESKRRIEHVPLLSGREIAEVLEVTPAAIRQLRKRKKIRGQKVGNTVLYTAAEIRRVVIQRDRRSRRGKRDSYSPILATWVKRVLSGDQWVGAEALNQLLWQAVTLPEPEKTHYIVLLWQQCDLINELLRGIRNRRADAENCAIQ